jgi:hypothetical protein
MFLVKFSGTDSLKFLDVLRLHLHSRWSSHWSLRWSPTTAECPGSSSRLLKHPGPLLGQWHRGWECPGSRIWLSLPPRAVTGAWSVLVSVPDSPASSPVSMAVAQRLRKSQLLYLIPQCPVPSLWQQNRG